MSSELSFINSPDTLAIIARASISELEDLAGKKNLISYREKLQPDINGKQRQLAIPKPPLMQVQQAILVSLNNHIIFSSHVHGGVKGRSTRSHASPHVGKEMVATLDVRSFFPGISKSMVHNALKCSGADESSAMLLASLITFRDQLPQGAPTSTLIANMVFRPVDKQLATYCRRHDLKYTRYVDDIAISGDYNFKHLKGSIIGIIENNGYDIAIEKTVFAGRNRRQIVTGLIVNDTLRPSPEFSKLLRRTIKECWPEHLGPNEVAANNSLTIPELRRKLWGRINYVKSIDRKLGQRLRALMAKINWPSLY